MYMDETQPYQRRIFFLNNEANLIVLYTTLGKNVGKGKRKWVG